MASIGNHMGAVSGDASNIRPILDDIQADLSALRAAIVGITAQLDADAGVSDTTYASGNDPVANKTIS